MASLNIRFEWDENKAASNYRKHKVTFQDATLAFFDPFVVIEQDRMVNGEERWRAIGMVRSCLFLVVAHTTRLCENNRAVEVVRIINARRLEPRERKKYYGKNR